MQFCVPSRTSGLRPLPRLNAPVRRSFSLRRAGATIRPAFMNYLYRIAKFRIEALSRVAADFGDCVFDPPPTSRGHGAKVASPFTVSLKTGRTEGGGDMQGWSDE